jgi:hypothetical protein
VRWRAWERKWQWKCRRVKARVSAWGASGCARGPEEGLVVREQVLSGRREAWWLRRQWRDVERRGEGQRGVGNGGASAGAARGAGGSGAGAAGARHMADEGGGVGQRRKNTGGGLEVDEGGLSCKFQKYMESTVKHSCKFQKYRESTVKPS